MRHGLRYRGTGQQLDRDPPQAGSARLRFDDPAAEATFVDYLAAVDGARASAAPRSTRTIAELVPESPYAELIARLRCFRGIDTLTAAGICAEVGDFARFAKPKLLAGFLGIIALGAHLR